MQNQTENLVSQSACQTTLQGGSGETVVCIKHFTTGRTGNFIACYEQLAVRNAQGFKILGIVDPTTYDAHECGQMFCIEFIDGFITAAWPEEVENALDVFSQPLLEVAEQTQTASRLLDCDSGVSDAYDASPLLFSQSSAQQEAGAQA